MSINAANLDNFREAQKALSLALIRLSQAELDLGLPDSEEIVLMEAEFGEVRDISLLRQEDSRTNDDARVHTDYYIIDTDNGYFPIYIKKITAEGDFSEPEIQVEEPIFRGRAERAILVYIATYMKDQPHLEYIRENPLAQLASMDTSEKMDEYDRLMIKITGIIDSQELTNTTRTLGELQRIADLKKHILEHLERRDIIPALLEWGSLVKELQNEDAANTDFRHVVAILKMFC